MKKILAVLLTVCMLLPMMAFLPAFAATPEQGFDFTDGDKWYYVDGTLADAPRTIEAWIYVEPNSSLEDKIGNEMTIISNFNGFESMPYLNVTVKYDYKKDGDTSSPKVIYPYISWRELSNRESISEARKFNFRNAVITPGEWTHIAIVIEAEQNRVACYLNGEFIQANTGGFKLGDITKNVTELQYVVGADNRPDMPDSRVFKGKIGSISLFNDQRTAAEVASDYQNGADYNDPNALAHWELSSVGGTVVDKTGRGPNLIFSKYWLTEAEMQAIRGNDFNSAYSFAVVGDIQYMTEWDTANGTTYVSQIHQWIANNVDSKNIQYVAGMGDVTNRNTDAEWTVALNAITSALNGKVPYSVINGNHDHYSGTTSSTDKIPSAAQIGWKGIDKYFAKDEVYMSQFTGENGGLYQDGSVANTYYKFTVGSTKWLFINLDFAPSDEVLAWANQVVASHPDHKVVMTTHGYVHMDGGPLSDEDSHSLDGSHPNGTIKNNGEEMWTKFLSLHENVVMVLSGHMECNNIMMSQGKGVNGNTVTQFLIDQQTIDSALMKKGQNPLGLVAMFYFDEDGENVSVEWYSTFYNKYFQTRNQFSFNMNADCEEQTFAWDGVSRVPEGSGTESDPYIVKEGGNLLWMANRIEQLELTAGATATFEDMYFKQVCDIDLAGLCIKSIGYYYTSQGGKEKTAAFAGHYDGGGYSIKNGRIISAAYDHEININWCEGLFGCIYGATVENVTLDNVTIWSRGVTGGIVGRAVAPRNSDAPSDFNVISNCHVKDNCRIVTVWNQARDLVLNDGYSYDSRYRGGVVGGIVGMAYGATVKNCTNATTFYVDGEHALAGGIAGVAGYNSVIENCAFTGGIVLTDNNCVVDATFGGIVGLLAPNLLTNTMSDADDFLGTLTIRNCYNSGSFVYAGEAMPEGRELHWGGILGHAKALEKATGDKLYLIENCYNLYSKTIEPSMQGNSNYWIGGIVGKADAGNYNAYDSLTVRNCASVTVAANGGNASASTNEYRTTGLRSMYNKLPVIATNVTTATGSDSTITFYVLWRKNQ